MEIVFTPYLIDLVKDLLLKSFWRKQALKNFLSISGVKKDFLVRWQSDESKRTFIDALFSELLSTDAGLAVIHSIKTNLLDQKSFPDLMNWEDSPEKIEAAKLAMKALKEYLRLQGEKRKEADEVRRSREQYQQVVSKNVSAKMTLQTLREKLDGLSLRIGTPEGGYAFQEWFYELTGFFDITSRRPYVTDGRQIDGSITILDTTYLVELKYTNSQSSATDIDSFLSKVSIKADNTMGIFLSMSGYSSTAIKAASRDKTPILLLDYQHVYSLILSGGLSFQDVIHRVKRHASQTGEAYLPTDKF
jgi:hypothetical protein